MTRRAWVAWWTGLALDLAAYTAAGLADRVSGDGLRLRRILRDTP